MSGELKELEARAGDGRVEARTSSLATLPNLPDPEAPDGETEEDAVTLREVGERAASSTSRSATTWISALANGWIEMEKAAEASGSRFAYLLGDLVMVELALVRFTHDLLRGEGLTPVVPPVLVREAPLFGTGFFPGEREMIYEVPHDELFLVGTSEVSLAALHAGEILAADELPQRYAGFSTCFRRESGAAGKDTRGIFRVHQFDKVEMFSFVRPEDLSAEHERLLAIEERILQAARPPVPGGRHRRRRPGRSGGAQVRLRGLDPEPVPLPGGHLVLEHHRLPGSPPRLPLSPRARRPAAPRAHPERHRRRRSRAP